MLLSFNLIVLLNACDAPDIKSKNSTAFTDTTTRVAQDTPTENAKTDEEIGHYFIVVADTGKNYFVLRAKLAIIETSLEIPIDTMGRYYNTEKDRIVIPEGDTDEIYAGEYFPRRFPSVSSSIEYLNTYTENTDKTTMAVITGIYEHKSSADSACKALQSVIPTAFAMSADIYIGCMH